MEDIRPPSEKDRFVKPQGAILTYSIETLTGLAQSPLVKPPSGLHSIDIRPPKFRQKQNEPFARRRNVNNRNEFESDYGIRHSSSRYNRDNDVSVEWDTPLNAGDTRAFSSNGFFGSSLEEEDATPSWYNVPLEDVGGDTDSSKHTVREFEEWKAKMRTEELRKQGYEVADPEPLDGAFDDSNDFFSVGTTDNVATVEEPKTEPVTTGVDRFFSMWGEGSKSSIDGPPKANPAADLDHGSRFSRFFGGSHPPPGLGSSQAPTQPVSNQPSLTENNATSEKDADKEGFQRIMLMLGSDNNNAPPLTQTTPAASQPEVKPNGDDVFFQSLLSKGSSSSTPATQNLPAPNEQQTPPNLKNTSSQIYNSQNPHNGPPGLDFSTGHMPPPPPGLLVDKNGNPVPPEFMTYPPPPMMPNQPFPPPAPFFGMPGPGQFTSADNVPSNASIAGHSTQDQQKNLHKSS